MIYLKFKSHIFLQNVSSRLRLHLYFLIHIYSFNFQIVSKTLWYTNKAHYIFFIRHLPRIYLHHMLFFHIDTMMPNDFYRKQQLSITLPLWSLHTLSNSTISRSRRQSSLSALKTTLPHERNFHNWSTTLPIAHRRSKHSTDPFTSS